jgi:spermidine synthase
MALERWDEQATGAKGDPLAGRLLLVLGVFFASGFAGLVYQVAWSRMLTLVIGVSLFAINAVICTFMTGLALGSYAVGRLGARWRNPLRTYGVIEAAIGLYALLTPSIFDAIQPIYASAFPGLDAAGLNAFRVALSALVLLVPTTFMGATLPLLSRAVAAPDGHPARGVGYLYGINTFGAVVGCLAAGFVLLPQLGIRASLFVAAAVNFAAAAAAIWISRGERSQPTAAPDHAPVARHDPDQSFVLAVFFFTGFAALGYEILWTRVLLHYVRNSAYAFSLMLAVYLLGVAMGSLAASRLAGRSRRPLVGLAVCQLGVSVTAMAGLLAFPNLDRIGMAIVGAPVITSFGSAVAFMFSQASIVLLLPTIFMGAMFPFGIAAYHRYSRGVERSVGVLYAVNTAGNIAGALVVGFATISLVGVRHSMVAMLAINVTLASVIAARVAGAGARRLVWLAAGAGMLLLVQVAVPQRLFYQSLLRRFPNIVYYRETASDTVAVVQHEKPLEGHRTLIYWDGRGAAGTWSAMWNFYFGHLPMLLHPHPVDVLHICFGSGNSLRALTRHDPQRVDMVELSPQISDAGRYFWTNEEVLDDPRVHLIIEDGRNFLLRTDRSYDVVSLEPPQLYSAGVVNLYTQEFYELVRRHLKPGGIMEQWLPTEDLSDADRGHLIRAFTEVFPFVYVWQQLRSQILLLIGTLEPLRVDVDALDRRLKSEAMRDDPQTMGTPGAEEFLSYFLLGNESARRLAAPYEPVRDDRTIIDYSIPFNAGSYFGLTPDLRNREAVRIFDARVREYDGWRDPMSTIIPDPYQARRVELVRERRVPVAGPPK